MFRNKYFYLPKLMHNEWRSVESLKKLQEKKLKLLIKHAYENVPMYRQLFDKKGIRPEHIQSLDDITKLPIIDKKDFHSRENSEVINQKYLKHSNKLYNISTSGSSGITLQFQIDSQYNEFRKAQSLRCYLTNGNRIFDRIARIQAYQGDTKKWFHSFGIYREQPVYSGDSIEIQIQKIKKINPDVIKGNGSALRLIASYAREQKINLPLPRIIFTDSELLLPEMRHAIEEIFQTKIVDIYGTFETGDIGYECHRHEGYHIALDCVIIEFTKNGKPVNIGEEGEIVCSVLDNGATPFIRYNLHDIGSILEKPCSCGRGFPLMGIIKGRVTDYVTKEDGTRVSLITIAENFKMFAKYLYEFQLIQEKVNRFHFLIVPSNSYDEAGTELIRKVFKKDFPNAELKISIVEKIDREPSGKLHAFKSLVNETEVQNEQKL